MKITLKIEDVDMFNCGADGIVNPCNALGVAGAGVSFILKHKFPDNYGAYVVACRDGVLVRGKVHLHYNADRTPPFIFNFPSKPDYRVKSTLDDIRSALPSFMEKIREAQTKGMKVLAVPALGAGLGGLKWDDVLPILQEAFEEEEFENELTVYLIPPKKPNDTRTDKQI